MVCRLAPEGDRAIEGQKSQPTGAKASEGKPEGKPAVGPKRGAAVSTLPAFFMYTPDLRVLHAVTPCSICICSCGNGMEMGSCHHCHGGWRRGTCKTTCGAVEERSIPGLYQLSRPIL